MARAGPLKRAHARCARQVETKTYIDRTQKSLGDLRDDTAASAGSSARDVVEKMERGASSPFRVSACAARTLNATGESRVTLSLQ